MMHSLIHAFLPASVNRDAKDNLAGPKLHSVVALGKQRLLRVISILQV